MKIPHSLKSAPRGVKLAMMAATSLLTASAVMAPVNAWAFDPAANPATVEASVMPGLAHAADQADQKVSPLAKRLGLIAVTGGVLAVLIRVIGVKKVLRAIRRSTGVAAKIAAHAAVGTAKVAGRVFRSPIRFMAIMAGLTLFALTGIGFYDVEWVVGLLTGAAMGGMAAYGLWKTRMALQPVRVKSHDVRNMENRN